MPSIRPLTLALGLAAVMSATPLSALAAPWAEPVSQHPAMVPAQVLPGIDTRVFLIGHPASPTVLTIGFARRFATYKRATLLFRNLDWLRQILCDNERPVLFKEKINYKQPGGGGFAPHQDATAYRFVDHHISCMVPLDPATPASGCLYVAPGYAAGRLSTDERGRIAEETPRGDVEPEGAPRGSVIRRAGERERGRRVRRRVAIGGRSLLLCRPRGEARGIVGGW